jgi:hypothetical protein
MMYLQEVTKGVTPAPGFRRDRVAGVQYCLPFLDSGFRRNDGKRSFGCFGHWSLFSASDFDI